MTTREHSDTYKNKLRYWWRVKLPGKSKYEHIPLKPVGAKYAAKDKALAVEVAKMLWREAVKKTESRDVKTISDLTSAYYEHCKVYYQHSNEAKNIKHALDFLENNTEVTVAQDFDSLDLQKVRTKMIQVHSSAPVVRFVTIYLQSVLGESRKIFELDKAQSARRTKAGLKPVTL